MTALRVATLAGDAEREASVATHLSGTGLDLVLRCVERLEALACIRGGSVDALLAVGPVPWFDYQCVEEARRQGCRLLGHAADPIEAELLEVAGFTLVDADDLLADINRPPERESLVPQRDEQHTATMVAVWGPKGAPGRTTVAVELASTLAAAGETTLLVDTDLYGGDIAQMLGIVEELPGLVPLARSAARGELRDDGWVEQLRTVGEGGPLLLPGLVRADLWNDVSVFGWRELLAAARSRFRYCVFDVGFCLEPSVGPKASSGRNEVARATVESADEVVAVVRADPVGLRSFLWALDSEGELLRSDKLRVVANRVRPGEEREVRALIRRHLGHFPVALIPDRPDLVSRALWAAEPVTACEPSSGIAEQIRGLAAAIGLKVPARGFLARLSGRRAGV